MNTKTKWVSRETWRAVCRVLAALGWVIGGPTVAVGSGLDGWGRQSDSGAGTLASRGLGWVTSFGARGNGTEGGRGPGLAHRGDGLGAGSAGIDGTFAEALPGPWEVLGGAGRLREPQPNLFGWLEAVAGGSGLIEAPASEPVWVTMDLSQGGPIVLSAGTASQVVPVWLRNDGAALDLGGLDLKIGITGGTLPAPAIGGVNLRAGDLFTVANSVQGGDAANTPQTQFWSVSVNDPFSPAVLPGSGAVTLVGSLILSTVGVPAGDWSLTLFGSETALLGPFGDPVGMNLVGGTLTVVPEPGWTALISGVVVTGWVFWKRAATCCLRGCTRVQSGPRPLPRA